jgi:threo-3-hydroxy-L-aspartate ammonia-lyase
MRFVSLDDIRAARERIKGIARVTPMIDVSAIAGRPLFLKCENMQPGGAFKIRGAYNMISQLSPADRERGVITYSSGNHGQAVAISARALGAPAVVVMPTTAPSVKVEGARGFGAEVVFAGTTTIHRRAKAEEIAAERGLTMVPPFDHEWIIAGQGTLGLEILEQCPDVKTVLAPIGGGGLVSGVAAAVKQARPDVAVVGVEPAGAASMKSSIDAGQIQTLEKVQSIADGLMAVRPGDLNFAHVRKFVDRLETLSDDEIAGAMRWLVREAKLVVEPSGAVTVAAALRGRDNYPAEPLPYAPPVVAIISGGNLDPSVFAKYLS